MLQHTLHVLRNPDRAPVTSITRQVRELCLSNARTNFSGAEFTWEWEDGELVREADRRPALPRDLARAVVRPMAQADLAKIVAEAVASLNGAAVPTPALDSMAAELANDTDLGMFPSRDALRHAALREAALRFVATVTGDRTD